MPLPYPSVKLKPWPKTPDAVVAHLGVTLKDSCGATTATILQKDPAKVRGLLDTANSFNSEFQCAGTAH